MVGARQEALLSRLAGDLNRLLGTRGVQAYCLECPTQPVPRAEPRGNALTSLLGRLALR
jgi:protease-4